MRTKIAWVALVIVLGIAISLLLDGKVIVAWLTGAAGFAVSAAIAGVYGNSGKEKERG